jgi:hypothetical protein
MKMQRNNIKPNELQIKSVGAKSILMPSYHMPGWSSLAQEAV